MAAGATGTSPSIGRVSVAVFSVLTTLALVVCAAVALLASALHREGKLLADGTEGVTRATEARFALSLVALAHSDDVRREAERHLRVVLQEAQLVVDTPEEAALLERARDAAAAFVSRTERGEATRADLDDARGVLNEFVQLNAGQAREAQASAARWTLAGTVLSVLVGGAIVVAVLVLLLWLRREVVDPIRRLAEAIDRFPARGGRAPHVPETGALELRGLAAHLNRTAQALAEAHRARLAFIAAVAHDLRNPLTAIEMSVGAARPDAPLPSERRLRAAFAVIERQVERLARMAGDFLDATRIEEGVLELRRRRVDLGELASEVAKRFEDVLPPHEIRLTSADEELEVDADPVRVEQILSNLISNIMKFSPPGSEVEVTTFRRDDAVGVSVGNRLFGIRRDELEQLWEPFRRSGSSADTIPGVGLGLSLVRRLAEAHGGRLEVDSTPERGARFTLLLPLAPTLPYAVRPELGAEGGRHHGAQHP